MSAGLSPSSVVVGTHVSVGMGSNPSHGGAPVKENASHSEARSQGKAARGNRRQSPRFTAIKDQVRIGWWAGDEFILVEGNVVNINLGGALVSVNPTPTPGQPVWLRLAEEGSAENLKAFVLESKWAPGKRRFDVRLVFEETCPPQFFETVISGRPGGSKR